MTGDRRLEGRATADGMQKRVRKKPGQGAELPAIIIAPVKFLLKTQQPDTE